jgi:hypothetical protein
MDQIVESLEGLLEGRLRIGLVDEEHVEPLDAEPLQAALHLPFEVSAGETAVVRTVTHGVEGLRAHEDPIDDARVLGLQPPPDEGLASPAAVGVGGVEEVDPDLERAVHDDEGLGLALALRKEAGVGSDAPEIPAA